MLMALTSRPASVLLTPVCSKVTVATSSFQVVYVCVRARVRMYMCVRVYLSGRGPDVGPDSGGNQGLRDCLANGSLKSWIIH